MQFNYAQCPSPTPVYPHCIRPLLQVRLYRGVAFIPMLAHIDSGADFVVVDKSVAKGLYIDWDKGDKVTLSGIDGKTQDGYFHDLELDLPAFANSKVRTKIVFTKLPNSICLLGQQGFFDHFKVSFDGKNERFTIDL